MITSLTTESLRFAFRDGAPLFEDLSLEIIPRRTNAERGFITVIMGPSGCGKSTLLRLFLGELVPQGGRVSLSPAESRSSYLSQDPVLFEHLSIRDNARYFAKLRSTRAEFDLDLFEDAARELRLLEVLARESMSIARLSGGEKQRIALLRALSIRPSLLLLDEACRGIDIPARQEFLYYLRRLSDQFGLAVVYVTHNPAEARLLADRVIYVHKPSPRAPGLPISGSLAELSVNPPHESVALSLAEEPMNRVPAEWDGTTLRILGIPCRMGDVARQPPFSGHMLFKASQVKWTDRGGFPSPNSEPSGVYELAALHSPAWRGILAGKRMNNASRSFLIEGTVHFCAADGRLVASGTVAPSESGESRGSA